jgi:hypothetical protein
MVREYSTTFSTQQQAELDRIGDLLRDDGWSSFVTVNGLLRNWSQLSAEVPDYPGTIDDYTNDLTSRDGLEMALQRCSPALRPLLQDRVESSDARYRSGTTYDGGAALAQFLDHGNRGWWWQRRPVSGRLADDLASTD